MFVLFWEYCVILGLFAGQNSVKTEAHTAKQKLCSIILVVREGFKKESL